MNKHSEFMIFILLSFIYNRGVLFYIIIRVDGEVPYLTSWARDSQSNY